MKTMLFIISVGLLATSGCATKAVWTNEKCRPTAEPHLNLAESPETLNVLVQYDEQRGGSTNILRNAYWLFTTQTNVSRPKFVGRPQTNCLASIPVFTDTVGGAPPTNGWYAVQTCDQQGFALFWNNVAFGDFNLPVYTNGLHSTAGKVALTPLAVAGDAVIVASVLALFVVVESHDSGN